MRPQCPMCHQSAFSFRALQSVHPYPGEFSPAKIICPSCQATLRVTTISRVIGAFAFLGILVSSLALFSYLGIESRGWLLILLLVTAPVLYMSAWTHIVRLKAWTPWQYWLPESRLVGYTVCLLIPVAVIVLLFYLGVHFGWGM